MSRFAEFFEGGEQNRLSMARLLQFLAYLPATYMALRISTLEAMSVYIGAFVLNTGVSKGLDVWAKKKGGKDVATSNRRR